MQKSQVLQFKAQGAPTSLQLGKETKEGSPEVLFFYLAAPNLSCSTQELCFSMQNLLVEARRI